MIARGRCAIIQRELHREIRADKKHIHELMERSPMLVTVLAPKIGYDNAAKVAKSAHMRGTALKEKAAAFRLCVGRGVRPPRSAGPDHPAS